MSSTVIAISAPAAASSSAALVAASRAEHLARCGISMPKFEPKTATVAEMRDYASCVYAVHGSGEPMSAWMVIVLKGLILAAVVGGGSFAYVTWREEGVLWAPLGFLAGAIVVPVCLVGLGAVLACLAWVIM